MTKKPTVTFVGSIAGIILCRCGTEMKESDRVYECPNESCEFHGKRYKAAVQSAVLFYEVKK